MKLRFPTYIDNLVKTRRKRPHVYLFMGILSLSLLGGLLYFYPPDYTVTFGVFTTSLIPIFVAVTTIMLFFLGTYTFKSKTHGFLIASFVLVYLLFRLNHLTHPFFFILLFALFLSIELFVSYRK